MIPPLGYIIKKGVILMFTANADAVLGHGKETPSTFCVAPNCRFRRARSEPRPQQRRVFRRCQIEIPKIVTLCEFRQKVQLVTEDVGTRKITVLA